MFRFGTDSKLDKNTNCKETESNKNRRKPTTTNSKKKQNQQKTTAVPHISVGKLETVHKRGYSDEITNKKFKRPKPQ